MGRKLDVFENIQEENKSVFMKFIAFVKKRYFLFILILFTFGGCLLLNPDIPMDGDCPYYLILAQSIASGQGYKDIYYPGNPPNTSYPFFYPLLLSLILVFFPKTVIGLKFISVIFGAASLVAIYILFSDKYHKDARNINPSLSNGALKPITCNFVHHPWGTWNWLLLLLVATNLWFLGFSALIMTEMVYIFFSLMTLLLLEKYGEQSRPFDKTLFIAAFSMAITFFTKPIALSISVAVFAHFMIKREYRKGFLLIGLWFLLISPWIYRNIVISKTEASCNYFIQFISNRQLSIINFLKVILCNIADYWRAISTVLLPGWFLNDVPHYEVSSYLVFLYGLMNKLKPVYSLLPSGLVAVINLFFSITIIFGFLYQIKKKRLMGMYVLFYLIILMLLHPMFCFYSRNRYLLCLLPFLLYYFLTGFFLFLEKFRHFKPIVNGLGAFVILIIFGSNIIPDFGLIKGNMNYMLSYKHLSNMERKDYYDFWYVDYFLAADWLKKNTPLSAIIMHYYPPAFYLCSNRKTVFFDIPSTGPYNKRGLEEIKSTIEREKVNYIITKTEEEEKIVFMLNYQCRNTIFVPFVEFKSGDERYLIRVYKVVEINPLVKLENVQGVFWFNKGKCDTAIQEFKKALKLKPNFIGYYNLGNVYERKGLVKKAKRMYRKALELEPNYEICKNVLNIISQREVIKQYPNDILALEKLGKYYLKNHNYFSAMEVFMEILKRDPNLATAYYNLGIAYINTDGDEGAYIWAIEKFRKAVKFEPTLRYKARHYIKVACKKEKERMFYALNPTGSN